MMRVGEDRCTRVPWGAAFSLAALLASCSRPNEDGMVDSVGQQREDADEIAESLRFAGGNLVQGSIDDPDPDGPRLESVQGPMDILLHAPFSFRLAVAADDAGRVQSALIQWKYAGKFARVPIAIDPVTGHGVIDGVDNALHTGSAGEIDGTIYVEDAQGRHGPGIPVVLDFLDPEDTPDPDSLVLASHEGSTLTVDLFERDGELLLASGGDDDVVTIWNVVTGHRLHSLRGHSAAVTSLSATRDGCKIASASRDYTTRIWDSRTGELLETFGDHQDFVSGIAYAPDDQLLASGSWDGTVHIRDLSRRMIVKTLTLGQRISMLEFSGDGAYLAVGSGEPYQSGRLSVWYVADWSLRFSTEFDREVTALNFATPATHLTAAVGRGRILIWDVASGLVTDEMSEGPQDTIPRLGFLPNDPNFVGALTLTGHMFVWNVPLQHTERDKNTRLWLTSADFSRDGRLLALGDSRGAVWLMPSGDLALPRSHD
jgi:WD40 repeat protein